MKYQLIENYFHSELFRKAVQDYFDTVLGKIISENAILQAKGYFEYVEKGQKKVKDYYDMPYHIHILNGLIPALFLYEKYLTEKGWIESPKSDGYLRIFILGFTFHDANKLLLTQQSRDKSDLEIAVEQLDEHVDRWEVKSFFPYFEEHKSSIYYLALATENDTSPMAEDYKISVNRISEIKGTQRKLCHFADGIASIQEEHLESIEAFYNAVAKRLSSIPEIADLPISYIKVRPNPYTLLSQNLLQVARKELARRGKKVLYAMREGFVYWGEDLNDKEYQHLLTKFIEAGKDDFDFNKLTDIDAQKCKFGFIGSIEFTPEILDEIIHEQRNRFLALSPNSKSLDGIRFITDYDNFVNFTKRLLDVYDLNIDYEDKDGKLNLKFNDDDENDFIKLYSLHKIQWLNTKDVKEWKKDFEFWVKRELELPRKIELEEIGLVLTQLSELRTFISSRVKQTNQLFKTYLNFIKTHIVIEREPDLEIYISDLRKNIIGSLDKSGSNNNTRKTLFDRYFECRGNIRLTFLNEYQPLIPKKKEMCVFTGGIGEVPYKKEIAFGLRSTGFSNKTVTNLSSDSSSVSELFAEENRLRASKFQDPQVNLIGYYNFFEANLNISNEIIKAAQSSKNKSWIKEGKIEFDKNVSFYYDLGFEFTRIKTSKKTSFTEGTYWFIRDHLLLLKELGVRAYITSLGTPYSPHKAAFHFEGAPTFLKRLGWNKVRLGEVNMTLQELTLVYHFGKKRITQTIHNLSKGRAKYFTLFYTSNFSKKEKIGLESQLINFIQKYKHKFPGMTITEELVKLAVKVDLADKSGAKETWLIRTALDYLRRYVKQDKSREDIIQKICGEIYRKLRMSNPDQDAIRAFAKAIYDKLYVDDWDRKIPALNAEKDWIYQFAFLFVQESKIENEREKERIRMLTAKKIKRELEQEGKKINLENIRQKLSNKAKKYAQNYLDIINNLNNHE